MYKIYLSVKIKIVDNLKNFVKDVSEKSLALFDDTCAL